MSEEELPKNNVEGLVLLILFVFFVLIIIVKIKEHDKRGYTNGY